MQGFVTTVKDLGRYLQTKGRYYQLIKATVSFLFCPKKALLAARAGAESKSSRRENETRGAKRSQTWSRENRLWIP